MVVGLLSDDEGDRVFQALSDATRRDIVERVALDGLSVSTLARHYDMSFAAVQKHVSVLERAALVTKSVADANRLFAATSRPCDAPRNCSLATNASGSSAWTQ